MVDGRDKHAPRALRTDLNHVGRRDDDDIVVALETVHCCQQLPRTRESAQEYRAVGGAPDLAFAPVRRGC